MCRFVKIDNNSVHIKHLKKYILMRKYFTHLLYNAKLNIHMRMQEDLQYENDCYYSTEYNYLI